MSERLLPKTKLVKSEEHGFSFSSYDVVTLFDDMKLGDVSRVTDQPSWTVCITVDHSQHGAGVEVVGYRRTRAEAVELVARTWMASIDEITAHKINDALAEGISDAEKRAEACLKRDATQPITDEDGMKFSPGMGDLLRSAVALEKGLKDDLAGKTPFGDSPEAIYSLAHTVRLIQLELLRRKRKLQDELIPSGDYREDEPIDWGQRARQLAEELGSAEANMIDNPDSVYRHLDDLDVRDHTVSAHNRLAAVKANRTSYVSVIQSRTMAYQALLNESHRRALLFVEKEA
jgi:hypothetical protein